MHDGTAGYITFIIGNTLFELTLLHTRRQKLLQVKRAQLLPCSLDTDGQHRRLPHVRRHWSGHCGWLCTTQTKGLLLGKETEVGRERRWEHQTREYTAREQWEAKEYSGVGVNTVNCKYVAALWTTQHNACRTFLAQAAVSNWWALRSQLASQNCTEIDLYICSRFHSHCFALTTAPPP